MMKFVLMLALLALYSATPTFGLKCYRCGPSHPMTCDAFEKLSAADKKSKASYDCGKNDKSVCGKGTGSTDSKKTIKQCLPESAGQKLGCDNAEVPADNEGNMYKFCACNTDYCNDANTAVLSRSPSEIFVFGFAAVVTFLNAQANIRLY